MPGMVSISEPRGLGLRWLAVGVFLILSGAYVSIRNRWAGPEGVVPPLSMELGRSSPGSTSPTTLRFLPEHADFGEIPAGQSRRASISITNSGPRAVRLLEPMLPCSCLQTAMDDREIPPGGMRVLNLTYTAIAGSKPADFRVVVPVDDTSGRPGEIRVTARTRAVLRVEPAVLGMGRIPKGSPRSLQATVRRLDGSPFRIKEAKPHRKDLVVHLEALESGRAWTLSVTTEALHPGWINDNISIVLEGDAAPSVFVAMTGEIDSDVEILPQPVTTVVDGQDHVAPMKVNLRRITPGELKIISVKEARGLPVEYEVVPLKDGRYEISIGFVGPFEREPFGELRIWTNVEDEPLSLAYRVVRASANR
jgi:hypothetical protein